MFTEFSAFDTFNEVRTYGHHPGRMSRVGGGSRGHFYVFTFYMFQSILNIFVIVQLGPKFQSPAQVLAQSEYTIFGVLSTHRKLFKGF